jgi:hypothetical protein
MSARDEARNNDARSARLAIEFREVTASLAHLREVRVPPGSRAVVVHHDPADCVGVHYRSGPYGGL